LKGCQGVAGDGDSSAGLARPEHDRRKLESGRGPLIAVRTYVKVDFAAVMRNAEAEGINLQQIAIQYKGLTVSEVIALQAHQQVTHDLGNGTVLAKFPLGGMPLFPEKADSVLYLGA